MKARIMKLEPDKVDLETPDLVAAKRAALEELFPGVLADGVLDAARLGELLDTPVAQVPEGRERYGLQWAGKHEAVRSLLARSKAALTPDLDNSIDFEAARNVFIEGDNLEVLKLLQKAYNDGIKLIYIDPPYNTGNDFVYNDDFADGLRGYLEYTGQVDEGGNRTSANADTSGRRHSRWLSMMYPRLVLARNLLTQDGVIAISIDDNEVANLRALLDEVFGPENFIAQLIWKSKSGGANDSRWIAVDHEYVLVFARNSALLVVNLDPDAAVTTSYPYGDERGKYGLERLDKQSIRYSAALDYEIVGPSGEKYRPAHKDPAHPNASWRWSKHAVEERYPELVFKDGNVYTKNHKRQGAIARSLLVEERFGRTRTGKTELAKLIEGAPFDNPKPPQLVKHLATLFTGAGDVVLDFFAGSGTTGDAVYRLSAGGEERSWILVQLPETPALGSSAASRGYESIAAITYERLVAASKAVGADASLRRFVLDHSNFRVTEPEDGELDLVESTLAWAETDWQAIAAEVFLKEGVPLNQPWLRHDLGGVEVIESGGIAVALTDKINDGLVRAALRLAPSVMVFLEDGFSGSDAVKANAVTNAKNAGITLKTV